MMHIENALLYGGVDGTRKAITTLSDLYKALKGNSEAKHSITQKWDGAPAVFVGPDPQTGEFFIAKKGIFNKNPKVYKSVEEIQSDTSGDLEKKLVTAFNELKSLPIDTILQGDMMFTSDDIERQTIDQESYYVFQPNTIAYAVPTDSELGKKIANANLGIVFHTRYEGESFADLSANYQINIDSLKNASSTVWIDDANVEDFRGTATMTSSESSTVENALANAGKHFRKVSRGILSTISNDDALAREIEQFQNTFIRKGIEVTDTQQHVRDLIAWYEDKFEKDKMSKKTERGQRSVEARKQKKLEFFSRSNQQELKSLFDLQKELIVAKRILMNHLEKLNNINTFVRTKDGFKVTGSEGFVIIDELENNAYKIVDRLEFSKNNFSHDIIKGWEK
jgi:hypothetical protein